MLNFVISTSVFSFAIYGFNRYFNTQTTNGTRSRTLLIMVGATLISMGAGWVVDQLDGDAELHKNDPSMVEVVQSGDPIKIAKLLAGIQ